MAEPPEAACALGVEAIPEPGIDRNEAVAEAARRLAGGEVGALDTLWDLCARDLYGLALWRSGSPSDAEDAVQEAFVRVARSPRLLSEARNPRAYLLAIAYRQAVDARRRLRHVPIDGRAPMERPGCDPERSTDARRASALVAALPHRLRAVVFLKHFAGLTFREIGRVTGVPTFTAASRYRAALGRLRREMGVER